MHLLEHGVRLSRPENSIGNQGKFDYLISEPTDIENLLVHAVASHELSLKVMKLLASGHNLQRMQRMLLRWGVLPLRTRHAARVTPGYR